MSRVVAPTLLNHVDKCVVSTDFIHSMEEASFVTDLRTWESRGITAPLSILCACLEKPGRSVCFSSFPYRYCLMNSRELSGVPKMLIPSLSAQEGP